jgi:hypothetical protein
LLVRGSVPGDAGLEHAAAAIAAAAMSSRAGLMAAIIDALLALKCDQHRSRLVRALHLFRTSFNAGSGRRNPENVVTNPGT